MGYFVWIMSCYAPQLAPWLHYVRRVCAARGIDCRHSLKVVQSEQYFAAQSFESVMTRLLCFVHFDVLSGDYAQWMRECVERDAFGAASLRQMSKDDANSKTNDFEP